MVKDKRYKTVKVLIESGHITTFRDIFDNIPKTTVALDMGTNYKRLLRLIENVGQFKIEELLMLARFFDVDARALLNLVVTQHESGKKRRRGK